MKGRTDETVSIDELVLRTALNVLRDSVESGKMPSGLPLEGAALDMHRRAIDHLEAVVSPVQRGAKLRASTPNRRP